MGEIEQVLDDELVVRLDMQAIALGAPRRMIEPAEVADLRRIGERRLAHPDPDPAVALDDRVAADAGRGGNDVLSRHADTLSGRIVSKAVVAALDQVARDRALVERVLAVTAAILERDDLPRRRAIEYDGLVQQDPSERSLPGYLVSPGRDVPGVPHKHSRSPFGACVPGHDRI